MPDLTAAQLQADLASVMTALPGAVKACTINGNAYSLLVAPDAVQSQEAMVAGLSPGRTMSAMLTRSGLAANDTPEAMQTTVVIGGVNWRVIAVTADPFGAFYLLTLAPPDYYLST